MIMKKLLFFIITLVFIQARSQSNQNFEIPEIKPPSIDTYNLGKYGNIPIGLFTGSQNINIPLVNMSVDGLNVPISLLYNSSGVKVDDLNGNIGLGWTLLAGGVITKVVRDLPDNGGVRLNVPNIDALSAAERQEFLYSTQDEIYDTESDLYFASFNGNSVKFIIDENGAIYQLTKSNFLIKYKNAGFAIIDPQGVEYLFDTEEITSNKTTGTTFNMPPSTNQSFYLTKIILPTLKEILFEYNNKVYSGNLSRSQKMNFTYPFQTQLRCNGSYFSKGQGTIEPATNSFQSTQAKQLKRISYNISGNPQQFLGEEILFTYATGASIFESEILQSITKKYNSAIIDKFLIEYQETPNKRIFLNKIMQPLQNKNYEFTYINPGALPQRLQENQGYSQDIFGYYNAKINSNLIPQEIPNFSGNFLNYYGADRSINVEAGKYGLLQKIVYPTKGKSLFEYERNTAAKYQIGYLPPPPKINTNINTSNSSEISFTAAENGYMYLNNASSQFDIYDTVCDSYEPMPNKHRTLVQITDGNGNPINLKNINETTGGSSYTLINGENSTLTFNVIKGQSITVKLTPLWTCTYGSATLISHYDEIIDPNNPNELVQILTDGYRVSKIVNYKDDTMIATSKTFEYENGIIVAEPIFFNKNIEVENCNDGAHSWGFTAELEYYSINSSSINNVFRTHPNVYYQTVKEVELGKGSVTHLFSIDNDYQAATINGENMLTAPTSNYGWKNGKELKTTYKDELGTTIKTVENIYTEDENTVEITNQLLVRKLYERPTNINDFSIANLDVSYYKTISRFDFLQSQKTTDFLNGNPLVTTTEYFYNSVLHYQPASQITTFPDKSLQENTYKYASDIGQSYLVGKNMTGIVLETTTSMKADLLATNKIINKSKIVYPGNQADADEKTSGLPLPKFVWAYDLQNPSSFSTEIKYNQYDDKGNILQYNLKPDSNGNGGIPTTIIWGYNQTQPIAKIEGATYGQVMPYITDIVFTSNSDAYAGTSFSEQDLIDKLDVFRKISFLENFQITTYTYDPLIGVRSITPPSGIREYYIYDTANRLQSVKDSNGNILKEYRYNYKP